MADNKFTFWDNMKETIEKYSDPVFKYKCYDALTEYGLYKTLPEDDGTLESQALISLCQSFNKSLETNWEYNEKTEEGGKKGGNHQLYSDENLIKAIEEAGIAKSNHKPTLVELVAKYKELFDENSKIAGRTFSRRFTEEERNEIIQKALKKQPGFNF